MSFTVRLFATACVLLGLCATSFARPDIPVQYVIISFDGAHDIAQWKRSRALERFAKDVCTRPDVACVSYSDYLKLAPAATGTDDEIEG